MIFLMGPKGRNVLSFVKRHLNMLPSSTELCSEDGSLLQDMGGRSHLKDLNLDSSLAQWGNLKQKGLS